MRAIKLRRALVYAATGMFFAVAALTQLQGDSISDVLVKASVSCGVLVAFGLMLVHIVEDASQKTTQLRMAPSARSAGQDGESRGKDAT